ncbi:MAG TPA: hypothetical protein PKC67_10230 [Kiritimatiellia bacterium]|nr:hypothetical protein [Kiritimatiellia bacterium]HMP34715.1 hypothetical protein [Kiritimatiellia bacterium]
MKQPRPLISRVRVNTNWLSGLSIALAFVWSVGLSHAQSGHLRTQVIELNPGWNAVYLEVDPPVSSPGVLLDGLPIDVVATFSDASTGAQYISNPTVNMLQSYGWAVWYAPDRSDAFLSNLYSLPGAKSYLVFSRTNATWTVLGSPALVQVAWQPNAYTLAGFPLLKGSEPTFAQFFRGSPAHKHNRIYRLVNGLWRQVVNPAAETMKAGEAYWIFSQGRSRYNGPLDVTTGTRFGVVLDAVSGSQITFRNRTDHPISYTVDHVALPGQPIPLSTPIPSVETTTGNTGTTYLHYEAGSFTQTFPPLAGGKAIRWPVVLRAYDAGTGAMHSLLKITSDLGTVTYLPVTASRGDD